MASDSSRTPDVQEATAEVITEGPLGDRDTQRRRRGRRRILAIAIVAAIVVALVAFGVTSRASHEQEVTRDVVIALQADGYDRSSATPLVLRVTGTASDGQEVDQTIYATAGSQHISLLPGSYQVAATTGALTTAGNVYLPPKDPLQVTVTSRMPTTDSNDTSGALAYTQVSASELDPTSYQAIADAVSSLASASSDEVAAIAGQGDDGTDEELVDACISACERRRGDEATSTLAHVQESASGVYVGSFYHGLGGWSATTGIPWARQLPVAADSLIVRDGKVYYTGIAVDKGLVTLSRAALDGSDKPTTLASDVLANTTLAYSSGWVYYTAGPQDSPSVKRVDVSNGSSTTLGTIPATDSLLGAMSGSIVYATNPDTTQSLEWSGEVDFYAYDPATGDSTRLTTTDPAGGAVSAAVVAGELVVRQVDAAQTTYAAYDAHGERLWQSTAPACTGSTRGWAYHDGTLYFVETPTGANADDAGDAKAAKTDNVAGGSPSIIRTLDLASGEASTFAYVAGTAATPDDVLWCDGSTVYLTTFETTGEGTPDILSYGLYAVTRGENATSGMTRVQ